MLGVKTIVHMGDFMIAPLRLVPIRILHLSMVTLLVASITRTHLEEWTPKKHELRTYFKLGGTYRGLYRVLRKTIKGYTTNLVKG